MSGLQRIAKEPNTKISLQTTSEQFLDNKDPSKGKSFKVKASVEIFKASEIQEQSSGEKTLVPGFMIKQVIVDSEGLTLKEAQNSALDSAADLLGL